MGRDPTISRGNTTPKKAPAKSSFVANYFTDASAFHACKRITHSRGNSETERSQSGDQRKPDQSSATNIESLGFAASYFTLAGCPATKRSKRTWLSRPVISCAV